MNSKLQQISYQNLAQEVEVTWAQNVMALYFHLKGGRYVPTKVDRYLSNIRQCFELNKVLCETNGKFTSSLTSRLPEIQEGFNITDSIEQSALPFIRSRSCINVESGGTLYALRPETNDRNF